MLKSHVIRNLVAAGVAPKVMVRSDLLGRQNLHGREMISQMGGTKRSLRHPDGCGRVPQACGGHRAFGELAVERGLLGNEPLPDWDHLGLHRIEEVLHAGPLGLR